MQGMFYSHGCSICCYRSWHADQCGAQHGTVEQSGKYSASSTTGLDSMLWLLQSAALPWPDWSIKPQCVVLQPKFQAQQGVCGSDCGSEPKASFHCTLQAERRLQHNTLNPPTYTLVHLQPVGSSVLFSFSLSCASTECVLSVGSIQWLSFGSPLVPFSGYHSALRPRS